MTMPAMVDLALTSEERAKENYGLMPSIIESDAPRYPWGLSIDLDETIMGKLKIDALPGVGDMIHGKFMAKVTRISVNDSANGEKKCICLQITHMALEDEDTETEEKVPASKKLYDKGNEENED